MKNALLIALMAFITLPLFSQINKGTVIVSVDGSYMKTTTGDGVLDNMNSTQGKYLSLGASVGYFVSDRFVAGAGLDYNWCKEDRFNYLTINRFYQDETTNIKSHVFLPNFYFGYYYPIINKLYLNTRLKFSYGKVHDEIYSSQMGLTDLATDSLTNPSYNDPYARGYYIITQRSTKTDFFQADLCPEVTYFISSKFSLCLGLGGIRYTMTDWKTDNSNWMINFNPSYWSLGIKIKI
jgi:hypothetical protein